MPRKPGSSSEKERGSCCSLEAVKYFLESDTIPEGYTKNDKRALRRRARSFVLIKDELYFTGGRSRHNRGLLEGEKAGDENPENEPDHTQVLRKVLFSADEQQEAVDHAHIAEDGNHYGMEKTTERVSNNYYWMGIIYSVRNTIHRCLSCSSRSKTVSQYSFKTGQYTVTPTTFPGSTAVSVMATRSAEDAGQIEDETFGDGSDNADTADWSEGVYGVTVDDVPQSVPTLIKQEAADMFYMTKDVCSYFWQKVEIQLFGPFEADGKQMYVAVALDCYSQFPEATVMEVFSPATLTNFVLNLFCRYGVMEKLSLLQNQVTKNREFFINTQDMMHAGISPTVLFPVVNPLDERWRHVEKSLDRFVKLFPKFWFHCLETFMVPLRITLPPEAEYTPYYLAHGREPPLSDKLIMNLRASLSSEIRLTEDQEQQIVEMIMSSYGIHTDFPSIPASAPDSSTAEMSQHVVHIVPNVVSIVDKQRTLTGQGRGDEQVGVKRRRGRPLKKLMMEEVKREEAMELGGASAIHYGSDNEGHDDLSVLDDSDRDVTYEPEIKAVEKSGLAKQQVTRASSRRRTATFKAQEAGLIKKGYAASAYEEDPASPASETTPSAYAEKASVPPKKSSVNKKRTVQHVTLSADDTPKSILFKRKRGRPCKNTTSAVSESDDFSKIKEKNISSEAKISSIMNLQQLPLDTFYFVLKQYKEHGLFPPGVSGDTKQAIARLCQMVNVQEGKLYSNIGKSMGRLIITGEKARVSVLRKAHARGEKHYGRAAVLKYLAEMNVFWKGMSLDLDAFIHGCPECVCHNPLRNKSVVSIPSKSVLLTAEESGADEPHLSEDEEEESSYEDLIQYLTDSTFPSTATPPQQLRIKQRSESFCIIKGSLYYSRDQIADSDHAQPRQVLFSESWRQTAIREAHIEDGNHLSQQDTQAKLRRKYFWSGMTFDILVHVMGCCMKEHLSATHVPHRNQVIQDRVDKFHSYFLGRAAPTLDTSAITGSELGSDLADVEETSTVQMEQEPEGDGADKMDERDMSGKKKSQPSTVQTEVHNQVDVGVVKAVEAIIEDMGKSLSKEDSHAETREGTGGKQDLEGQSPFGSYRSRKDAHKCQHCGKFISGNVAYRIHLYKHTGVKPFSCSTCGKSFTTSKSLQVHTRKHTGVKPYLCNQCGREFFRGTSFKYHLKTHTRTKLKPLPCDQCNREFLTQNRLDKHKEYKHPAVPKMYMCKHCGKIFTASRSLKWHEQSHLKPRKYQCTVCGKDFSRKEYLDVHQKTSHTEEHKTQKASPKQPALSQSQQLLPQLLQPAAQIDQQSTQLLQSVEIPTSNISVIQWSEEEHQQAANRIAISEQADGRITITEHGTNQISIGEAGSSHITISEQAGSHNFSQPTHTTVHILTQAQLPLATPPSPHSLPISTAASHLQSLHHTLQQGAPDVLLQQEAVPVQYEVECLTGDPSGLTEADLNAVHLLAQASLNNQNILH